jgi:hypothetical protein
MSSTMGNLLYGKEMAKGVLLASALTPPHGAMEGEPHVHV